MPNNDFFNEIIKINRPKGTPLYLSHIVEHQYIERIAGVLPGEYKKNPEEIYIKCQKEIGTNFIDQYIPLNPLQISSHGYEEYEKTATTGIKELSIDGMTIGSAEDVIEHMESFMFPRLRSAIDSFNESKKIKQILDHENEIQTKLGPEIVKLGCHFEASNFLEPEEFIPFPHLHYYIYGYENYFMAYALYPDIMEKSFSLQADYAELSNRAAAKIYSEGKLPPIFRMDFDLADSRGTMVDIKSLDKIWFPHFVRSIKPLLKTNMRLLWHCDGNLMKMVPRLIDVGIKGFQGFEYEYGMDYEKICNMKTKDGEELIIIAGVSVTTTLPLGSPSDIKKQMSWVVENGPKSGLILCGGTSSLMPGIPWENIKTLIEGLKYYKNNKVR